MPSYELMLVFKKLAKPELVAALRRTTKLIYENNGLLYNLENFGTRELPYRAKAHGSWNTEASYFVVKFDSPSKAIADLRDEYKRDVDIIRHGFTNLDQTPEFECTLEEELQPPAYRPDVKKMMTTGKRHEKKYSFKTGLDYNPFRT